MIVKAPLKTSNYYVIVIVYVVLISVIVFVNKCVVINLFTLFAPTINEARFHKVICLYILWPLADVFQ
jgi:hypothetical protein